ncbi:MAG: enoyl-[acyl-carrier-protein] reductase FabK [Tissierellia bacterium]|nr:enoyl-[acyl-carrier-protein] reductase FabK [Tissierellia bacterium]
MNIAEILGIKYPVIQGGMARIARGKLAAAVSNAGGLGLVGTGGFTVDEFKKELEIADQNIEEGKFYGINIVLMEADIEEKIQIAIEKKIKVVTIAAGNPAPFVQRFKDAGVYVICVVGNSKMAQKCETLGADAVVIEGLEAGGHLSKATTMGSLLPVVKSVSIPVISAGGYGHGSQILAAQVMGAAGVQLGSRWLAADETPVPDSFKEAIVNAKEYETDITGEAQGHPLRQVSNHMTKEYLRLTKEGAPHEEIRKVYKGSLEKAVNDGDVDNGSLMAGITIGLVNQRESVAQIMETLIEEYKEAKKELEAQKDFLF